uniref:Uncharacterized protein n=1 Tax=Anopheles atroparvus TaxID=41427 RepID=A0A182JG32_ANOAO
MSYMCTVTEIAFRTTSRCVSSASACSIDASMSFGVWMSSWCVDESISPSDFCVYASSCSSGPPSCIQSWCTFECTVADFSPTQNVLSTSIATNNTLPACFCIEQPSQREVHLEGSRRMNRDEALWGECGGAGGWESEVVYECEISHPSRRLPAPIKDTTGGVKIVVLFTSFLKTAELRRHHLVLNFVPLRPVATLEYVQKTWQFSGFAPSREAADRK